MALGRHVDVDKLIGECKDHRALKHSHDRWVGVVM